MARVLLSKNRLSCSMSTTAGMPAIDPAVWCSTAMHAIQQQVPRWLPTCQAYFLSVAVVLLMVLGQPGCQCACAGATRSDSLRCPSHKLPLYSTGRRSTRAWSSLQLTVQDRQLRT
eukprot:TRINITY_DN11046_c0_g1_i1.p4 TRINITY_DN11046_c0_g1~~TRINITY_DN11046_c0_g1_i1.p4  ORF type:complete len:116 (-),score=13.78 TRINITY_DN11046_c0_g1_i1:163-510(-)